MKKPKRLIWQLFPSYLLITILSIFAVSWYASKSLRQFYKDQSAIDLQTRTNLISKLILKHLSPLDAKAIDTICKEIGSSIATRFTIILPSGAVIGDSIEAPARMDNHGNRPEIIKALAGEVGRSTRYSNTLLQEMMYIAAPLVHDDRLLAVVRAALPITFIESELKLIRIEIIIGGVIIALIGATVSLFVSRRISRPLETMKEGADRFAEGDLDHRLTIPESTEMAGLAQAMNHMATQLEDRIKKVNSQRNELKAVLTSMLESVIAVDREEHIISMNQAAARIFEAELSTIQKRSVKEIVRNLNLQRFITMSLSSREPLREDFTLYKKQERILNVKSTPLVDADKVRIGTLIVINDVTNIRRLENIRRDFVANVSHEIKTPLTAIKGFVETLQHGKVKKADETKRFLNIIQKHVDRLSLIIEDLLTLSKIEQEDERRTLNLQNLNISDIFQTTKQLYQPKAEEKGLKLKISGSKDLRADLDSTLIEQAIVNLLDNAIKFSNPGGSITLACEKIESEILIRVQDQGIGIDQKHLPRLFERFYRVDRSRSRNLGGTGLGLAIVKHIAQAHGGYVTALSSLGEGSTFTLHLPVPNQNDQ